MPARPLSPRILLLPCLLLTALPLAAAEAPTADESELAETRDPLTGRRLPYRIEGEYAVSGDVILGRHVDIQQAGAPTLALATATLPESEQKSRVRRASRNLRAALWPNRTIHYSLQHASAATRLAFLAAVADIEAVSALRFVERVDQTAYIDVHTDPKHCRSVVGRSGGAQRLSLAPWCEDKGAALHEILHALGFGHEHQRPDRDAHIRVSGDSASGPLAISARVDTRTPYDLHSIMHYRLHALQPRAPGATLPRQLTALSDGDIQAINTLYPVAGAPGAPDTPPALSADALTLERDGVGHVTVYGGSRRLRGSGVTLSGAVGFDVTIVMRPDNTRRLVLRPRPAYIGTFRLAATLHFVDGTRATLALPVRVEERLATDGLARQLVARHDGLCLQAAPDGIAMRVCQPIAAQRWTHRSGGEIVNDARPDHCLEAAASGAVSVQPCRPDAAQQWLRQGALLATAADPGRTLHDGAAVTTASGHGPTTLNQWDWR
jgi:hypothetical protein